jgi:hypothetical protein
MRVESGRIRLPWGSFVVMAMRTGAHGVVSSSLRRVRGTLAAWCGGGSRRRACRSPGAVAAGTVVLRTCSRCSLWVLMFGCRCKGDSRGGKSPGRCLLTVDCANRKGLVVRGGVWRESVVEQRRRKGKSGSVYCTFGVGSSQILVDARRIQIERILGRLGRRDVWMRL